MAAGQPEQEAQHEKAATRPGVLDNLGANLSGAGGRSDGEIAAGKPPLASTGKSANVLPFASTGKSQPPAKMPVLAKQQNASTGKTTLTDWTHSGLRPPYPKGYELSTPHGKAEIEVEYRGKKRLKLVHGYQILWRTKCADCQRKVRPVACYFGPLALHELLKENRDVQEGIVSFKLLRFHRKQAGIQPRCRGCARQDIGGVTPYSAASATGS